jgi:branched-chain amino acid transport system permease protein
LGQLVVNGLAIGSIYALVALGLLLIFNTVQIVNFAQGQLLMLGAFIGISGAVTHELPVAMAWIITVLAMAFVGIVFMVLVYFPLRGRPPFLVILTTIAMGIVLENRLCGDCPKVDFPGNDLQPFWSSRWISTRS